MKPHYLVGIVVLLCASFTYLVADNFNNQLAAKNQIIGLLKSTNAAQEKQITLLAAVHKEQRTNAKLLLTSQRHVATALAKNQAQVRAALKGLGAPSAPAETPTPRAIVLRIIVPVARPTPHPVKRRPLPRARVTALPVFYPQVVSTPCVRHFLRATYPCK